MEAKDGSMGFDFVATYSAVDAPTHLTYHIADGRKVDITFTAEGDTTQVTIAFEGEGQHTPERQREGWQAILDEFKRYTESL